MPETVDAGTFHRPRSYPESGRCDTTVVSVSTVKGEGSGNFWHLSKTSGRLRKSQEMSPVQLAKNHLLRTEDTARRRRDGVGALAAGSSVWNPNSLVCSTAIFPHTCTPAFCLAGFTRGLRSGDMETLLA